jgi:phage-related holin
LMAIWQYFTDFLVCFMVIWYISTVLVSFSKKNLATLEQCLT